MPHCWPYGPMGLSEGVYYAIWREKLFFSIVQKRSFFHSATKSLPFSLVNERYM